MAEFEISKNYELKSSTIAKGLKRKGINFVAIDFDKTLIAIHAGKPEWSGTVQDMIDNVRPFFRCLIPQLLEQEIYIAIVTFSTRVAEIEQTLAAVYGDDAAEKIVIRGQDHKWMYVGNGSRCGKQMHMASAAAAMKNMYPDEENKLITRRSTLLLDDCHENIEAALLNGVCAIQFLPDEEDITISNMLRLFPDPSNKS